MKFTKKWLYDYLNPGEHSFEDILKGFLSLGLEIEQVVDYERVLAGFVTARILEAVPHPNAQKLQICTVSTHNTEVEKYTHQIVCGASNARVGLTTILATPGAVVPKNGMQIAVTQLRGIESQGMLTSAGELNLALSSEGIIELPENTPLGVNASVVLGLDDILVELGVTPNLGHLLGVRFLAQALANLGIGEYKFPYSDRTKLPQDNILSEELAGQDSNQDIYHYYRQCQDYLCHLRADWPRYTESWGRASANICLRLNQPFAINGGIVPRAEGGNTTAVVKPAEQINFSVDPNIVHTLVALNLPKVNANTCIPYIIERRLQLIGIPAEARSNIFSALTAYMRVDSNQNLWWFDLDKLGGILQEISVEYAGSALAEAIVDNTETFSLVGGYSLDKKDLTNNQIPLTYINGVIVGVTGVDQVKDYVPTTESKNVVIVIESLQSQIAAVACKELQYKTEASYRSQRYNHIATDVLGIGLTLLQDLQQLPSFMSNADLSEWHSLYYGSPQNKVIKCSIADINSMLGTYLTSEDIQDVLLKYDLQIDSTSLPKDLKEEEFQIKELNWIIPLRLQHLVEIPADLCDLIIKHKGSDILPEVGISFQIIPLQPKKDLVVKAELDHTYDLTLTVKKIFATLGLYEVINLPFVAENYSSKDCLTAALTPDANSTWFIHPLHIVNPINANADYLRTSILHSLIANVENNLRQGLNNFKLFEVSNIYLQRHRAEHSLEKELHKDLQVAGVLCGENYSKDWRNKTVPYSIYDAKEVIGGFIYSCGLDDKLLKFKPIPNDAFSLHGYYCLGKSAYVYYKKTLIGRCGHISPWLQKANKIKVPVVWFELSLNQLPLLENQIKKGSQYTPQQMPIHRDFAFIVDKNCPADAILSAIRGADRKNYISDIKIFDVFFGEGTHIPESKKSIAFSVTITCDIQKTLTDAEINELSDKIIFALSRSPINAVLRDGSD